MQTPTNFPAFLFTASLTTAHHTLDFISSPGLLSCPVHKDVNRKGISVSCVLPHPQGLKQSTNVWQIFSKCLMNQQPNGRMNE